MATGGNGSEARARVVLVDDEPDIVFLARTLFERDGRFDVVGEAGDGEQAVRLAEHLQHSPLMTVKAGVYRKDRP